MCILPNCNIKWVFGNAWKPACGMAKQTGQSIAVEEPFFYSYRRLEEWQWMKKSGRSRVRHHNLWVAGLMLYLLSYPAMTLQQHTKRWVANHSLVTLLIFPVHFTAGTEALPVFVHLCVSQPQDFPLCCTEDTNFLILYWASPDFSQDGAFQARRLQNNRSEYEKFHYTLLPIQLSTDNSDKLSGLVRSPIKLMHFLLSIFRTVFWGNCPILHANFGLSSSFLRLYGSQMPNHPKHGVHPYLLPSFSQCLCASCRVV